MSAVSTAGAGAAHVEAAYSALPAALEAVPEKTLATIREAFNAFGHAGVILRTDLAPCLRTLGYHITDVDAKRLFDELAPGGKMEYMAFLVVVSRQMATVKSPEAMIRAFSIFDDTRKGYITTGQFRSIMCKLGENPIAATLVDEMIAYADPEDSGLVEYDAFVNKLFTDCAAQEKARTAAVAAAKAGGKGGKK